MSLHDDAQEFLPYLDRWLNSLPTLRLGGVLGQVGADPSPRLAAVSVDLIGGFAKEGPLASPRVDGILPRVVALFTGLERAGIQELVFLQDAHPADAPEFAQFAPHCIRGTDEAKTVPELEPFLGPASRLKGRVIEKNSINGNVPAFLEWEEQQHRAGISTFIVVGDCTDLCIYNLCLPWKTRANEEGRGLRLIVPADCVQTYDLSVTLADRLGLAAHPGDLLHALFLYHLSLNGIEVVKSIEV